MPALDNHNFTRRPRSYARPGLANSTGFLSPFPFPFPSASQPRLCGRSYSFGTINARGSLVASLAVTLPYALAAAHPTILPVILFCLTVRCQRRKFNQSSHPRAVAGRARRTMTGMRRSRRARRKGSVQGTGVDENQITTTLRRLLPRTDRPSPVRTCVVALVQAHPGAFAVLVLLLLKSLTLLPEYDRLLVKHCLAGLCRLHRHHY